MSQARSKGTPESETGYRIGDILLDPARREVSRNSNPIKLGKLSYEFLLLLIESAPAVVSTEEIGKRLWKGRVATPDTIRQRAKLLRQALDDDADNPSYIQVIHGQGFRLVPDVEVVTIEASDRTGAIRKNRRNMLVAVAAVVAFVAWWMLSKTGPIEPEFSASANDNSLAILPFENLTGEIEDAYFVDGFHNDLLTQLSKISSFKVISRTSVLGYRSGDRNLREIGRELDVSNILEGSIQRSGDSVRINAQLIDARTDAHLWAERYDRDLTATNLFEIQSEMATAVAGALRAVLTPVEIERLNNPPTENTKAYNHYLLGSHYLRDAANGTSHESAAMEFQKAVDEGPEFALAWAWLGRAHSAVYFFMDPTEARADLARNAIDNAFAVDPELPEAYFARGFYRYHVHRDYGGALDEWSVAERGMAGDANIFQARGYVYGRMGDWERSLENFDEAIKLDPRNIENLANHAYTLARFHEYDDADLLYARIVEIEPGHPLGHGARANLAMWRDGNVEASRAMIDAAPNPFRPGRLKWMQYMYERDYEAALALVEPWPVEVLANQRSFQPKSWFIATTLSVAGETEEIPEYLLDARNLTQQRLEERPNDWRALLSMADILALEGDAAGAAAYVKKAKDSLPLPIDAASGPHIGLASAFVFAAAGDADSAIAELDQYLSKPAVWSIEGLLPDPRLDTIREHPRFLELVDKYKRL
jgi:TolB-like protein/DNA-binding winged helix-turn-helix (wHTH) protein/Tfp pilus assembly protein PilF